ncbi:hypothetical protein Glove_586g18 [Diversispora epigaea]|uniref:GATA-type domain-containing protein n=1 Tax=Diversispora epigaea TaxID=1348612 RepID=A0A397GAZ4_9GLOM|nr:hypothetical protein Glove_586g18 [Diversispora epigaea]
MSSSPTICFWSLLSIKTLCFVYISPWLSKALGSEQNLLLGTSFFDYFHPEEQEMARRDLSEFVKKKSLTCSITRCQYNNVSSIRRKLQQSSIMNSPQSPPQNSFKNVSSISTTTCNDYKIMNVGMYVVSHDIVLACFHSDNLYNSSESEFSKEELNKLFTLLHKHSSIERIPQEIFLEEPNRIFQILDANSSDLLFNWPDPNISGKVLDVSYNKADFSRLLRDIALNSNNNNIINNNINKNKNNNNNHNDNNNNNNNKSLVEDNITNCLQSVHDKRILLLKSGKYSQVESVIIPYGDIIFACFQILPSSSSVVSISLGGPSIIRPKAKSAPCSPATNICISTKRLRSPGSLSPLPSSHYYDDIGSSNGNGRGEVNNNRYFPSLNNELNLDQRSSKRQRHQLIDIPNKKELEFVPLLPPQTYQQFQYPPSIPPPPPTPTPSLLLTQPKEQPITVHQQNMYYTHHNGPQTSYPPTNYPPTSYPPPSYPQNQPQPHNHNHNSQQQQSLPLPPPPSSHPPSSHPSSLTPTTSPTPPPSQIPSQLPPTSSSSSPPPSSSSLSSSQVDHNQNHIFTPLKPTRNSNATHGKKCESCHTSSSPEWRRGPTGHKTLCNACGLRYSRTLARENRKREQQQLEQEQRYREQREREERAREKAEALMMQRIIEPYNQYNNLSGAQAPPPPPSPQSQPQLSHHQPSVAAAATALPHPNHYNSTLPPISHQPPLHHLPPPPPPHHHHHNHHHNNHNHHQNSSRYATSSNQMENTSPLSYQIHPSPPPPPPSSSSPLPLSSSSRSSINERDYPYQLQRPFQQIYHDRSNLINNNGSNFQNRNHYDIREQLNGPHHHHHHHHHHSSVHESDRFASAAMNNMMNNMPPPPNTYPKAYYGRAQ